MSTSSSDRSDSGTPAHYHDFMYTCQWRRDFPCGMQFRTMDDLWAHLEVDHVGFKRNGQLNLKCRWGDCNLASKRKRDNLISHMRTHFTNYRPFVCHICNQGLHRDHELRKHLFNKHGIVRDHRKCGSKQRITSSPLKSAVSPSSPLPKVRPDCITSNFEYTRNCKNSPTLTIEPFSSIMAPAALSVRTVPTTEHTLYHALDSRLNSGPVSPNRVHHNVRTTHTNEVNLVRQEQIQAPARAYPSFLAPWTFCDRKEASMPSQPQMWDLSALTPSEQIHLDGWPWGNTFNPVTHLARQTVEVNKV